MCGLGGSRALARRSYISLKVFTCGPCGARLWAWRRSCAGLGGLVRGSCGAGFGRVCLVLLLVVLLLQLGPGLWRLLLLLLDQLLNLAGLSS